MHPYSFPTCGDDSGSTQVRQMATDLRLIRLEYLDEKTDANFLIADQVNDSQARSIRERAKEQFLVKDFFSLLHNEHYLNTVYMP